MDRWKKGEIPTIITCYCYSNDQYLNGSRQHVISVSVGLEFRRPWLSTAMGPVSC